MREAMEEGGVVGVLGRYLVPILWISRFGQKNLI
jgi:hypothetical protein